MGFEPDMEADMQQLRQLLREAKCPHNCNKGVITTKNRSDDGFKVGGFCDWCFRRKEILRDS